MNRGVIMKPAISVLLAAALVLSSAIPGLAPAQADERETAFLLYFNLPLGGSPSSKTQQPASHFGVRVERNPIDTTLQYRNTDLVTPPPLFDLKLNGTGVDSLNLVGLDVLKLDGLATLNADQNDPSQESDSTNYALIGVMAAGGIATAALIAYGVTRN